MQKPTTPSITCAATGKQPIMKDQQRSAQVKDTSIIVVSSTLSAACFVSKGKPNAEPLFNAICVSSVLASGQFAPKLTNHSLSVSNKNLNLSSTVVGI